MEVIEKDKTIFIHGGKPFPIRKILIDGCGVLVLVWGVFAFLVFFSGRSGRDIFPYFVAISLLLLVPMLLGILIRQSRYHRRILFDGEKEILFLRGLWRVWQVPFDQVREFQIDKYRLKRDIFLYRLNVVLHSGKTLRLVHDVPDRDVLGSLGNKVGELVRKPLKKGP
ncbi:MAG: hypothetical protein GTN81_15235 [Proteobacteria bacterium]|nr:hypothetical protein [Pseudomonadota bacterium]